MLFKRRHDFIIVNPEKLKGRIFIGYFHGHETIIVFVKLDGYKEQYKRLLSIKFEYGKRV